MKRLEIAALLLAMTLAAGGCGKTIEQGQTETAVETGTAEESETAGTETIDFVTAAEEAFDTTEEDGQLTITSYHGSDTAIEIPAEIDGKTVTAIGESCFQKAELVAVKLPDTLKQIDSGSFYMCENLKQVVLPDGVTEIGAHAFAGCEALEQMTLPDSITKIGAYAFNASGLKQIQIPEGVTAIEEGTFFGCASLESVQLPEGCLRFGADAFYNCTALQELNFPEEPEEVGVRSLKGTPWFEEYCEAQGGGYIVFGDRLYGCGSKPEETMPEVRVIDPYAFMDNTALTDVVIPDSVEEIGAYAFGDCTSLKSVEIPDSVTQLGVELFYECGALSSVRLPDHKDALSEGMFEACYSLREVDIPESVTSIPDGCFVMCYSLADFTLPEGLTAIGERAFGACLDIEELYIPEYITEIGSLAFAYDTFTTINCQAEERPEGWAEDWFGTEEDENTGTVNWGVEKES